MVKPFGDNLFQHFPDTLKEANWAVGLRVAVVELVRNCHFTRLTKSMLIGREVGKKVTFQELLMTQLGDLQEEFKALSPKVRDVLVSKHQ